MRFTKTVVVHAHQWWKNGDHPDDNAERNTVATIDGKPVLEMLGEGKVVRRFRHPDLPGTDLHRACGSSWDIHGWIKDGNQTVCPGDWVVTVEDGKYEVVKQNMFDVDYFPAVPATIVEARGRTVAKRGDKSAFISFVADCRGCESRPTFHEHHERAAWVGKHRVTTGHTVDMYEVEE